MDTNKFEKKISSFIYGKTKTINPIAKEIKNCPEESLEFIKVAIFRDVKYKEQYSNIEHESVSERGFGWFCGSQIILHKLYELKPELFDENSIPNSNLKELLLKREQWMQKEEKGPGILLDDLKGVLFLGSIVAVIVSILIFIFAEPEDSGLRCYMINGEKVCKYESDWEEVRENFEDSVNNIPER